jgi:hypothetical protein
MMMVLSLTIMGCQQQVDIEAERRELLNVHETDRRAHFATDVDLLLSHGTGEFITVAAGRIDTTNRAHLREHFSRYFDRATYYAWDDLNPPIIRISKDGTLAWMITRVHVRRVQRDSTGTGQEREFVYAGIMTYEKLDGKWLRTANVSTFE